MRSIYVLLLLLVCSMSLALADEFVGPFSSWKNVKTDYGAVGDGAADDTAAIQHALDDLRRPDNRNIALYVPAGTYRITGTLSLLYDAKSNMNGLAIYGEDPARTIIRWDGAADGIMFGFNAGYSTLVVSRSMGAARRKRHWSMGVNSAPAMKSPTWSSPM